MEQQRGYNPGALGVFQVANGRIRYGAANGAASAGIVNVAVIPAGAIIMNTLVEVEEAFNCGSPVLQIGKNASVDDLVPSASITEETPAFYQNGTPVIARTTEETTIKAKLSRTGAAGTTGIANVMVFYVRVHEA
jgi:hypothetical protein